MNLHGILVSDLKLVIIDNLNPNILTVDYLAVMNENKIKYTFLGFENSDMVLLIFDTFDDFMLFKLRFSNNFDTRYQRALMSHHETLSNFITRVVNFIKLHEEQMTYFTNENPASSMIYEKLFPRET